MRKRRKLPKFFILRSKDLEKYFGSRVAIKRAVERGVIQSVGSGFYSSPSIDPISAATLIVAKYYPKAVISNKTALYLHKLADFALEKIDVDISKETKISNKFLAVHRVSKNRRIGISKLRIINRPILIYDLERTLCEAYRMDSNGPIFFTALKRYLKQRSPDFEKIKYYDEVLRTNVLVHLAQELADA